MFASTPAGTLRTRTGQMIKGVFTGSWETIKEGADKMGEALDDVFDSEESKKNVEDWVNETNGYLENAISNVKSKEKIKFISEDDVQGAVDPLGSELQLLFRLNIRISLRVKFWFFL